MTLEQLRIFIAVAERQHMTRAAEALNLTQQAVSAAIVTLENAYSTALFHRVGRHIELTEAGRLYLEEARSVLTRAAAAELALSELGGLKRLQASAISFKIIRSSSVLGSLARRLHCTANSKYRTDISTQTNQANGEACS